MPSNAYEFAKNIESRIEALSPQDYLERPRAVKRLIEELYPLSRFALLLKQPGLNIKIEAFENSGQADGHIWITGFRERDFAIQVTYAAYERPDALRSRLLARQGFAPGAGPISENKKTGVITATMEAEDIDAPIKRLGISIHKRVLMKTDKPYPHGTVLLVAFENQKIQV